MVPVRRAPHAASVAPIYCIAQAQRVLVYIVIFLVCSSIIPYSPPDFRAVVSFTLPYSLTID